VLKRIFLLTGLLATGPALQAQPPDSVLLKSDPLIAELDSILASSDSTSFLRLLDSLVKTGGSRDRSQLAGVRQFCKIGFRGLNFIDFVIF
jgi:hypothetical protein